jgi:hypothetical protein
MDWSSKQIWAYDGGTPVAIGDKARNYISGIPAGYKGLVAAGQVDNRYLLFSIPYGASATFNNLILEYDTKLKIWHPHTHYESFVQFVKIGGTTYGLTATGKIYNMDSGTTDDSVAISWSHITGAWDEGGISGKKTPGEIWVQADLPVGSTMKIAVSPTLDGNDFVDIFTFTANATEQVTRVQVPLTSLQNVNWYRLKFYGTGPCEIYKLENKVRVRDR